MSQTCSAVRKFLQNEATAKNLRREGRAQRGCDQAESKEVEVACFSPRFPEENAPAWAKAHAHRDFCRTRRHRHSGRFCGLFRFF